MFTRHDLGKDISYGREFSICKRASSKVDNDTKNFSDILKVLKTLRDMHRTLVKAIAIESGESDSTHHFELGKFDIPTSYDEIWKLTKIARIMLQIKKLLRYTVSRFKRIIERAEKEKFLPGKVTIIKKARSKILEHK
ncbi:hypothetical protein GLOIN_2v1485939 [Rhizophagus irregularis DAOM 181602=DAOM 197198]|nr:hypothetical protein GLOIN_2v1485939 [Rhizophagus irregularis DAOM 181602=DAOM 197198]